MDNGLGKRIYEIVVKVIKYCRKLSKSGENKIIKNQLIKSSSSCGANYEEAQSASSKADFKYKIDLTLREMRESNYWLRLLNSLNSLNDELLFLIKESKELMNILGSISSKIKVKVK